MMNVASTPDGFFLAGTFAVLVGVLGYFFPPFMRIGWWNPKWDENNRAWTLVILGLVFSGIGAWKLFEGR
jgi:hypothetical protein